MRAAGSEEEEKLKKTPRPTAAPTLLEQQCNQPIITIINPLLIRLLLQEVERSNLKVLLDDFAFLFPGS